LRTVEPELGRARAGLAKGNDENPDEGNESHLRDSSPRNTRSQ
jgi:hypothetical protein